MSSRAAIFSVMVALIVAVTIPCVRSSHGSGFSVFSPSVSDIRKRLARPEEYANLSFELEEEEREVDRHTNKDTVAKDVYIIEVDVPDTVEIEAYEELLKDTSALAHRLVNGNSVWKDEEKGYSLWLNKEGLVLSYKSWFPFWGWHTYVLPHRGSGVSSSNHTDNDKRKKKGKSKKTKSKKTPTASSSSIDCSIILSQQEEENVTGTGAGGISARVDLKCLLRSDRTIRLSVEYADIDISGSASSSSSGERAIVSMPHKQRKQLMLGLQAAWAERVCNEISLLAARSRQRVANQKDSNQEQKRRKEYELDRIINPDKYKAQSPTVRRSGGQVCE